MDTLAQGDILKHNAVTELPLIHCLNKIAFEKAIPNTYTNLMLTGGRGFE